MSKYRSSYSFSSSLSSSSPRTLFGLSKKEWIFEKFSCTLWGKIFVPGQIYCTENHLYFYGEMFGHEHKIAINFTDIKEIRKAKSLGSQSDSIEIHTKSGQDCHFTGFADLEKAYDLIQALYQRAHSTESEPNASLDTLDGSRTRDMSSEDSTLEPQGKIICYEPDKNKTPQETLKVGLPLSMDRFYDLFFGDEAVFSLAQAMELGGASEVQLTKWRPAQDGTNNMIKEMTMIVKVKGVPFKSKARVQAILTCSRKSNELQIKIVKKTLDIPYADAFQVEEKWLVQPEQGYNGRCILTNTVDVVFSKSVSVEKLIKSRTYESVKAEHELWLQNAKNRQAIIESDHNAPTPLLTPIKDKILIEEQVVAQDQHEGNNEVARENTGRLIENMKNVSVNTSLRSIIFFLLVVITLLIVSVIVLYTRLNALQAKFEIIELAWRRSAFDYGQDF